MVRAESTCARASALAYGPIALALLAAPLSAQPSGPVAVTAVRYTAQADTGTYLVTVSLSAEARFRSERLSAPDRVFVDIDRSRLRLEDPGQRYLAINDGVVQRIRLAQTQPSVTRIVLDLEAPVSYSVSRQSNPPRLLIELKRQGTPATPPMVSESKPAAAEPRSAPPQAEPPPAAPAVQAAATPSATTAPAPREPAAPKPARAIPGGGRTLTRTLGLKLGRVVLDPGHGGNDHGTTGPSGLKEKELVLDIATRLGTLLEEGLGSEVIYTRQEDVFLALEERTALANRRKADLFLSIHANSSPLKSVSGSETYYLNFTTSKVDLEVAARENASSSRSIFELRELIQKIALKEKLDESREFAARVQRSMHSVWVRNGATRNRGVKKAPFVVLIGASMPSVLAEVGFVSNPRDEAYLKKPENRQKIAEGLYRGIEQYARTLSHFDVAQRGAP